MWSAGPTVRPRSLAMHFSPAGIRQDRRVLKTGRVFPNRLVKPMVRSVWDDLPGRAGAGGRQVDLEVVLGEVGLVRRPGTLAISVRSGKGLPASPAISNGRIPVSPPPHARVLGVRSTMDSGVVTGIAGQDSTGSRLNRPPRQPGPSKRLAAGPMAHLRVVPRDPVQAYAILPAGPSSCRSTSCEE